MLRGSKYPLFMKREDKRRELKEEKMIEMREEKMLEMRDDRDMREDVRDERRRFLEGGRSHSSTALGSVPHLNTFLGLALLLLGSLRRGLPGTLGPLQVHTAAVSKLTLDATVTAKILETREKM